MIGNGDDTPDAADRERIRKGWQIELAQWAQEDQERRARLDCEECERQEDIERWRRERAEHAKEIQRLQEERKWVLELGSMWDKPQDGPQCLAYNVRDRVVHFHGPSLCKIAPVHLEDRTVMAERCTVQDVRVAPYDPSDENIDTISPQGQIVGHFEEIGHPECRPKWGAVYDKVRASSTVCIIDSPSRGTLAGLCVLGRESRNSRMYSTPLRSCACSSYVLYSSALRHVYGACATAMIGNECAIQRPRPCTVSGSPNLLDARIE